jgi:hypothetical protein
MTTTITTAVLATLALAAAAAATDVPADLRGRAQAIVTKGGYQTTLPAGTSAPESVPSSPGPTRPRGPSAPHIGGLGAPLIPAGVLWPLLAVIGAAAVALVLWRVIEGRRAARSGRAGRAQAPDAKTPSVRRALRLGPLTDVEDLARQGRFGEAIHLLLLHLFAALQRRPATAPAPAHTGREVLARTRLAPQARDALGVLVAAAETVHFGGRDASREDYDACLAHYRRFLDAFERAS